MPSRKVSSPAEGSQPHIAKGDTVKQGRTFRIVLLRPCAVWGWHCSGSLSLLFGQSPKGKRHSHDKVPHIMYF